MSEHAWGCSLYIGFKVAVEVAVEGDWIRTRLDSKIMSIELPVEHAKLSTLRPAIQHITVKKVSKFFLKSHYFGNIQQIYLL